MKHKKVPAETNAESVLHRHVRLLVLCSVTCSVFFSQLTQGLETSKMEITGDDKNNDTGNLVLR